MKVKAVVVIQVLTCWQEAGCQWVDCQCCTEWEKRVREVQEGFRRCGQYYR
jgi:hypothetical protein